jgi:hypothetical protein
VIPILLPALGRIRDDEDQDEDEEKSKEAEDRAESEAGEEADRVPVIPWSDEDGDADSWETGDLPWGSAATDDEDDDPGDDDPGDDDPGDDDPGDGDWDDLGWAERRTSEPAPVEDDFALPAMSSWQRRKSDPATTTSRPENRRSGGVEPSPEELEGLWARRRAEADARREELRLLRAGRRRDEAEDKNDDEGEKEIVPRSSELLRQNDGVWGAGQDESGVIG